MIDPKTSLQAHTPLEVVDVRIYQGIHFRYADEVGREQGERIAHWAFSKVLRPVPGSR